MTNLLLLVVLVIEAFLGHHAGDHLLAYAHGHLGIELRIFNVNHCHAHTLAGRD